MSAFDKEQAKKDEPVMGIPYQAPPPPAMTHQQQGYYVGGGGGGGGHNHPAYQAGRIPPNAVYHDPKGIPLQQTIFRDTPAPFSCVYCGSSGLTTVKSKPSLAAAVGCLMPFGLGICFLCPSMDCLWHKYHYCPHCNEKVADFEKSDPCMVIDLPQWTQTSFAVPL